MWWLQLWWEQQSSLLLLRTTVIWRTTSLPSDKQGWGRQQESIFHAVKAELTMGSKRMWRAMTGDRWIFRFSNIQGDLSLKKWSRGGFYFLRGVLEWQFGLNHLGTLIMPIENLKNGKTQKMHARNECTLYVIHLLWTIVLFLYVYAGVFRIIKTFQILKRHS